ncbi:MAG: metallophosphoesterase family protein, partial [Chthoniobacter sp.]|uniref:metallophosphoesterase family protein n=1 Tax=Chthoniobacter sp. TaxID=2510640 RepID=UPI0032AB85C3
MRFAIFGDIHANLEALKAVMADAEKHEVTHYVCLGDVVGYNANPHECLEIVRNLDCPVVKGNHDEQASISQELEGFNPLA